MQQEISTSSRDEAFWFYCCIVKPESPRFSKLSIANRAANPQYLDPHTASRRIDLTTRSEFAPVSIS